VKSPSSGKLMDYEKRLAMIKQLEEITRHLNSINKSLEKGALYEKEIKQNLTLIRVCIKKIRVFLDFGNKY
jgi:uncharacterized protein YfkK (UPF0435 family)